MPFPLATWFTLTSPATLLAAFALCAVIILVTLLRRPDITAPGKWLTAAGLILLSLAAGGLTWLKPDPQEILVMVDLSPSTRSALYRDPHELARRINELLRNTPHRLLYFADANHDTPPAGAGAPLPDLPADRTTFSPPPDAKAILLFSDLHFDLPAAAPRTYIVVDPLLIEPPDSQIQRLEHRGDSIAVTAANHSDQTRPLTLTGARPQTTPIPPGALVIPATPTGPTITARIQGDDLWPENDRLETIAPPPALTERWWIGPSPPSANWRRLSPSDLPLDPAAYLSPSIIILNNISAPDLAEAQLHRLHQYIRDLGGSLLILGGDRSFSAGSYPGTPLDTLSPLASSPPSPTIHWMLLADSSGSMAAPHETKTRWDLARDALLAILAQLPPEDPASVGSFSETLRWWSSGKSARETRSLPLPPPDIGPHGPTNLESALTRIIADAAADASLPRELLILTDGNADLRDPASLAAALRQRNTRLHTLILGGDDSPSARTLQSLATSTGGQSLTELTPGKWTDVARRLFAQASPPRLIRDPVTIDFTPDTRLPDRRANLWNRTWLKKDATLLASAALPADTAPLAARWTLGAAGQVLSAAFTPTPAEAESLATLIARPPRDPRYKIKWETGPILRITIDALSDGRYLNDETLLLELLPAAGNGQPRTLPIPQTAPGAYELTTEAPRQTTFATIKSPTRILDRTALSARYPPEFDAIGNDSSAMRTLAHRTGGTIIAPTDTRPIPFNWPTRPIPLASWLAIAGATLIAAGLLHWWIRG